jgi:hypothetical protein
MSVLVAADFPPAKDALLALTPERRPFVSLAGGPLLTTTK